MCISTVALTITDVQLAHTCVCVCQNRTDALFGILLVKKTAKLILGKFFSIYGRACSYFFFWFEEKKRIKRRFVDFCVSLLIYYTDEYFLCAFQLLSNWNRKD